MKETAFKELTRRQLDRLSLAKLEAEENRAAAHYSHMKRLCLEGEACAARDYRDNVTFARQEKQYRVQCVEIVEEGKNKLRFSFTATPSLLALLEKDGEFDEAQAEEVMRLAILQGIFDTEARLARRPAF